MKFFLTISIFSLWGALFSLFEPQHNSSVSDTLIGSKVITNELAGSAFRRRATGYFVIVNGDTSRFISYFKELKEGGRISLDIHYTPKAMTYRQWMQELSTILPVAQQDYNFDSLQSLFLGRLVYNGDIAIYVTKEYRKKVGKKENIRTTDYKKIEEFLTESKLAADLNELFNPYNISVSGFSIEKVFFTTKKELLQVSAVETDPSIIPDKILDCITWVKLKKK